MITTVSFNFSNCTDMKRMYHIFSMNVMAKAFTKAEEIIRKSLKKCQSDQAWSEKSYKKFTGCTHDLRESSSWIDEIYADVEKLAAEESNISFILLHTFKLRIQVFDSCIYSKVANINTCC